MGKRKTTGPLNERQRQILSLIAKGNSHMKIAGILGCSRVCVAENAALILTKSQVESTAELMYQYGRVQGLREAAEFAVLDHEPGLASDLRERADGILP